jgi:hypothetical protein
MRRKRTLPNRTFIVLAVIMIALFVVGLAAIVMLAKNVSATPAQLTASAVANNNFVGPNRLMLLTQTQAAIFLSQTRAVTTLTPP